MIKKRRWHCLSGQEPTELDRQVMYWEKKGKLVAVEVKSNEDKWNKGLSEFKNLFHPKLCLVVGDGGMRAEEFLSINPSELF